MNILIPVILAGGQGTRLWPASLPNVPKQFLSIGGESLIQRAMARALAVADQDVLIVTNKRYMDLFSQRLSLSLQEAERVRLIGEPEGRNTAPAIALALRYVQETYGNNTTLLIVTADHIIEPQEVFMKDVGHAKAYAEKGHIVTFGIVPTRAETGYGYIECMMESDRQIGYHVRAFHEKPDEKTAEHYLAQGNFVWNSGMFCFAATTMYNELKQQTPSIAEKLLNSTMKWKTTEVRKGIRHIVPEGICYTEIDKLSIDCAVMEGAENVIVVPASFAWNDVGNWDEVCNIKSAQEREVYLVESENVSVFSDIPVGVCGLSDIVVVMQNGFILVMKKGSGQLVKHVAELHGNRMRKLPHP